MDFDHRPGEPVNFEKIELPKKDVYIVDSGNEAATSLMKKLCDGCKPGAVIFVTKEEFDCLNTSVIRIEAPSTT